MRTGSQWRDLPEEFGKRKSVFVRFRRWVKKRIFTNVFNVLSGEPDLERAFVDGTVVKAHAKASGAKKGALDSPSDVPEEG